MSKHSTPRWVVPVAVLFAVCAVAAFWALNWMTTPTPGEDVGADPAYANAMGQRFRTGIDLRAIGVTLDRNYASRVDTVSLVAQPGFGGPEVVQHWVLPKGAELRVVGVRRWGFGPLAYSKYVVERLDAPAFAAAPMTVRIDDDVPGNFGLDPRIFQPLGREAPR